MVSEADPAIYIVSFCIAGYPAVPFVAWYGLYVILDQSTETSELNELTINKEKKKEKYKNRKTEIIKP
jgi:methylthioribose-1-phosphate isomerase